MFKRLTKTEASRFYDLPFERVPRIKRDFNLNRIFTNEKDKLTLVKNFSRSDIDKRIL